MLKLLSGFRDSHRRASPYQETKRERRARNGKSKGGKRSARQPENRTNKQRKYGGEEQLPGWSTSHLGTTDPHPSITFTLSSHLSNTCVSVLLRPPGLIFNLIALTSDLHIGDLQTSADVSVRMLTDNQEGPSNREIHRNPLKCVTIATAGSNERKLGLNKKRGLFLFVVNDKIKYKRSR